MSDNADLFELELSHRTRNILLDAFIFTIKDLQSYKDSDLLKLRNLGNKSLKEIRSALEKYDKNNHKSITITLEELNKSILEQSVKAFRTYSSQHNNFFKNLEVEFHEILKELKIEVFNTLFSQINELRTLVLEQSRILEGIQNINRPDGVINKISEKVPGFNNTIYELYKKLSEA